MVMPIHIEANAALGLLAALLWGGGDFSGSMAVKRAGGMVRSAVFVVLVGHLLSLGVIATLASVRGDTFPHGVTIAWGVCGGVIAGISLVAFYMALAKGHMGSAAAVSGLLCAAIPAVVSGFTEGAPGWHRLLGFVLAGAAIWLIASASESPTSASRSALVLSTLSGIGFGVYFVSLKFAGEGGLLWPMGLSRIGSSTTAAILLVVMSLWPSSEQAAPIAQPKPSRWLLLAWIVAGAALDSGGNISFLAATRAGRLDVAAVLASIYPASTILLAAVLLKERTTSQQRWGMILALPAVVLITL
jgi:drug/metabolite transporter (DMT)-like permease